ncbi:MAG: hypothetical protein JXB18_01355 [Sedimentisphaerales bacterium]|nr:hypothetical protein [Sedimentisphaerales bacterium]
MMFTIDLLKGAGLPKKSRPIVVAIAMVPLLIPLMGTVVLAACWQHNRTLMQTQQKIIDDNQVKINASADDLTYYTQANSRIFALRQQLEDVDLGLQYRIQISDILKALTESLPDNLVLTRLDLNRTDQQKKETDQATGNVKQTLVIQRKLRLEVGGVFQDQIDASAEEYIQKLRSNESLSDTIETIQIVARNNGHLDGQNCAFYEIECLLKEQN